MTKLDDPRTQTIRAISAWREDQEAKTPPRQYLGASIAGHHCERYLWLSFRLAGRERFDGRMLRLFDRGQREEAVFVSELRAIGCEVHDVDANGKQFAVSALGGHLRGHLDGAVVGIPESPKTWHVLEFKTHSAKSFRELESKGVMAAKPMHYAQMQIYMGLTGMTRALYLAVNKDNDALYQERIEYHADHFKALIDRAERIIFASEPPAPISPDGEWYQCKWCHLTGQCHGTTAPAVNCRSCAHSTPEKDGTWSCEYRKLRNMPFEDQLNGCADHRHFPQLLANWAEVVDAKPESNWIQYRNKLTGFVFANCEGGTDDYCNYSSAAITAEEDKALIGADRTIEQAIAMISQITDEEIPF